MTEPSALESKIAHPPDPQAQDQPGEATLASVPFLPDVPLSTQVEAMLFVSDEGLSAERLAASAGVTVRAVLDALADLDASLQAGGSGLALRHLSSGWRLTTSPACAPLLERFVVEGQSGRLSPAALETLAVVAYRQPVSRGRIAAIRGVAVDGVVRTLLSRGLLEEVGSEPSGALVYAVSALFLDKLGIQHVTDLPSLAPLLPDIETLEELDDQAGWDHRSGTSPNTAPDEDHQLALTTPDDASENPDAQCRQLRTSAAMSETVTSYGPGEGIRLQRVLAQAGIGSRRALRGAHRGGSCLG